MINPDDNEVYSPEPPAPLWAKLVFSALVVMVISILMYGVGVVGRYFGSTPWWEAFTK